jgi:hypothetical protein
MDTSTIASLATAGGTLILAIATFSSTRSANRAARVSEQALNVGLRPLLFSARPQDATQKVGYGDDHWVALRGGLAVAQEADGNIYLAMPLRNVAAGIAVLHGWYLWPRRAGVRILTPTSRTSARRRATCTCLPATSASGRPRCATTPMSCTRPCARRSPRARR